MDTRRSAREEEKEFTEEQVKAIDLKKHKKILNSGMWTNKDTNDDQILDLVGVVQKLEDDSKK